MTKVHVYEVQVFFAANLVSKRIFLLFFEKNKKYYFLIFFSKNHFFSVFFLNKTFFFLLFTDISKGSLGFFFTKNNILSKGKVCFNPVYR